MLLLTGLFIHVALLYTSIREFNQAMRHRHYGPAAMFGFSIVANLSIIIVYLLFFLWPVPAEGSPACLTL